MKFVPAGEIIGSAHLVRTVKIARGTEIPDGEYSFVDTYCTDPSCDCRKTMVQVLHDERVVATINFGWERPAFYQQWMRKISDDNEISKMHGASIDISSPNLVKAEEILKLFNALLNEKWIGTFKRNYASVKTRLANKPDDA